MTTATSYLPIDDSRAFRKTMGLFATGVTVVTTEADGEIRSMTANAITSVSLKPPLILICVQKTAHIMNFLRKSGKFSINILNENQTDLSLFFANLWSQPEPPPFTFTAWLGGPRLVEAMGAVACQIDEILEGGDHWIITALVIGLYRAEHPANPLLYYNGKYERILNGG